MKYPTGPDFVSKVTKQIRQKIDDGAYVPESFVQAEIVPVHVKPAAEAGDLVAQARARALMGGAQS